MAMIKSRGQDRLCTVCTSINFEKHAVRSMESPWKLWQYLSSNPSKKLSTWSTIQRNTYCPFCRLVTSCVRSLRISNGPEPEQNLELSNRPSWKMCISLFHFNGALSAIYSNRAELEREAVALYDKTGRSSYRLLISWVDCDAVGQIQSLVSLNRPRIIDEKFLGRKVAPEAPDWDLLRWWLKLCTESHGEICTESATKIAYEVPPNMRVIDVMKSSIVAYRRRSEYVALTYVWGEQIMGMPMPTINKQLVRECKDPGKITLPERLPRTILDAIEVVKLMGYRYLWVDSLCIVQDDDEDRHSQLCHMDAVYSNATLTIAAAAGKHADYGLPGVSRARRFIQQYESINGLKLAIPLPRFDELNFDDILIWNTRAWTFQEKVLSKKLLIFTDYQIYFKCSNAVWSEDMAVETSITAGSGRRKSFKWAEHKLPHDHSTRRPYSAVDFLNFSSLKLAKRDRSRGSFANYAAVAEEYTRRTLTFQQDVLPAINGVLKALNPGPLGYVGGLPTEYLHEAMLWHPRLGSRCTEVSGTAAPSWSWARWSMSGGCIWHKRDIADTHQGVLWNSSFESAICWMNGPSLGGSTVQMRRLFNSLWAPTTHMGPPPRLCIQESGYIIGWNARVGELVIGMDLEKGTLSQPSSSDASGIFRIHSISGSVVGEVCTAVSLARKGGRFQFVEVSEGKGFRTDFLHTEIPKRFHPKTTKEHSVSDYTYNYNVITESFDAVPTGSHTEYTTTVDPPGTWKVKNILLIEWKGSVAYRRGIGKVLATAWEKIHTRRQIYLG